MSRELQNNFEFRKEPLHLQRNKSEYFQKYIRDDPLEEYKLPASYSKETFQQGGYPPLLKRNHRKIPDLDDDVM